MSQKAFPKILILAVISLCIVGIYLLVVNKGKKPTDCSDSFFIEETELPNNFYLLQSIEEKDLTSEFFDIQKIEFDKAKYKTPARFVGYDVPERLFVYVIEFNSSSDLEYEILKIDKNGSLLFLMRDNLLAIITNSEKEEARAIQGLMKNKLCYQDLVFNENLRAQESLRLLEQGLAEFNGLNENMDDVEEHTQINRCLESIIEAIKLNPKEFDVWFEAGNIYFELAVNYNIHGAEDYTRNYYLKALDLDPENALLQEKIQEFISVFGQLE